MAFSKSSSDEVKLDMLNLVIAVMASWVLRRDGDVSIWFGLC
jgi:hypothetical protein